MSQSDIAISAHGLGKSYRIGHRSDGGRSETLRDAMTKGVSNFARKTGDVMRGRALIAGDSVEDFWALKDVSFEVKRGEAVGIIGHNGAGKSTLLKVLSRITEPTAGQVRIAGRIASLLEVGTGFHPELSGRENIYLNGAILGMTRSEINRKFDEIVDFAGVERFLDTPVKRYSSGMYVRLAFSVAAHLEPEILVVDEVLAVGDTAFQQKCLGKMQDVAGEGRTVVFVSHNLGAIKSLCQTGVVLREGKLEFHGEVDSAIGCYLDRLAPQNQVKRLVPKNPNDIHLLEAQLTGAEGEVVASVGSGEQFNLKLTVRNPTEHIIKGVNITAQFWTAEQSLLAVSSNAYLAKSIDLKPGVKSFEFSFPKCQFTKGAYSIKVRLGSSGTLHELVDLPDTLTVHGGAPYHPDAVIQSSAQFALLDFNFDELAGR